MISCHVLVVKVLNDLQSVKIYSLEEANVYGDGRLNTNTMYQIYAEVAWGDGKTPSGASD
jgi:hypothetical protein